MGLRKDGSQSTLADGDVVMLYRSGDAAGNIDGMETSHYLDAIGLNSTSDVQEPDVLLLRHIALQTGIGRLPTSMAAGWGLPVPITLCGTKVWTHGIYPWAITGLPLPVQTRNTALCVTMRRRGVMPVLELHK